MQNRIKVCYRFDMIETRNSEMNYEIYSAEHCLERQTFQTYFCYYSNQNETIFQINDMIQIDSMSISQL